MRALDDSNSIALDAVPDHRRAERRLADRRQTPDRRAQGWRSFLYGNFHPRRRLVRRELDDHLYLFDWYESRVLYLALGVMLLSCTDALFTLNLLNHGATEANIFMAGALRQGMDWFLASKISLTGVALICLVAVVRRPIFGPYNVEHLLRFLFATYLLVIGYEVYLFEFVFELGFIL